jgi:hypothetical protein
VFPAKVAALVEHIVWVDVFVAVGLRLNVITTSSVDAVQGEFDIVHLKVYDVPAVPLNAEVLLDGVEMVPPNPLTILHNPVPTVGEFAASVTDVNPQVEAPV